MTRAALAATRLIEERKDGDFYRAKIATARFFADHMLVTIPALAATIADGSVGTLALTEAQF